MTEAMTYKRRNVARKGNTLWYGDNSKQYVVMMQLDNAEEKCGVQTASTVRCFLVRTDAADVKEKFKKQTVCASLYAAMELADAWLKSYGI